MNLFALIPIKILFNLWVVQPGELPVPKKAKENQIWGNFTLMDFLEANWAYLLGILFIIALLAFYNLNKKAEEKKKRDS